MRTCFAAVYCIRCFGVGLFSGFILFSIFVAAALSYPSAFCDALLGPGILRSPGGYDPYDDTPVYNFSFFGLEQYSSINRATSENVRKQTLVSSSLQSMHPRIQTVEQSLADLNPSLVR